MAGIDEGFHWHWIKAPPHDGLADAAIFDDEDDVEEGGGGDEAVDGSCSDLERGDFPDGERKAGGGQVGDRHSAAGGPLEADEENGDNEN